MQAWKRRSRASKLSRAATVTFPLETSAAAAIDAKSVLPHHRFSEKRQQQQIPDTAITHAAAADDIHNVYSERSRAEIIARYAWARTFHSLGDVGWLRVKLIRAEQLRDEVAGAAWLDAFCVAELGSSRRRGPTERRCRSPVWNCALAIPVLDLHDRLLVSVMDERLGCLGRVALSLLRVANGERRWYGLRDPGLRSRAPGAIEMELDLVYNPVRAALRTLRPRQISGAGGVGFRFALLRRDVHRVAAVVDTVADFCGFFLCGGCFRCGGGRGLAALACCLALVWNFEPHLLPCGLAALMVVRLGYRLAEARFAPPGEVVGGRRRLLLGDFRDGDTDDDCVEGDGDGDGNDCEDAWRERLRVLARVQAGLDSAATLCERIRHAVNWTEPRLSGLALAALAVAAVVLHLAPLRLLALAWLLYRFARLCLLARPDGDSRDSGCGDWWLLSFFKRVPDGPELAWLR